MFWPSICVRFAMVISGSPAEGSSGSGSASRTFSASIKCKADGGSRSARASLAFAFSSGALGDQRPFGSSGEGS
nr:hypothetical protein Iba_chr12dCG8270 [Ipomoea batatas]